MQVVFAGETRFALQRACERATQPQLREYVNKNDLLKCKSFWQGRRDSLYSEPASVQRNRVA